MLVKQIEFVTQPGKDLDVKYLQLDETTINSSIDRELLVVLLGTAEVGDEEETKAQDGISIIRVDLL
jgi:hypothetical protein